LIFFPHCKINLGLQVLQKRSDGYHDIASVFYPVPLCDALEIVPQHSSPAPPIFHYGLPINGSDADNLCLKAWQLLKKDHPGLPPVEIHLLKNIPMGAGLGGGSSDGAFMLRLLNNKYNLQLTQQRLIDYALQLGSDCPFFINNQPCYATGRGEIMEPLPLDLKGYQLVLAFPGIHINTGWAFSHLSNNRFITKKAAPNEVVMQPISQWKHQLVNDFEQPVFESYPALMAIKEYLYSMGAEYASMSGSGSTIFGIFNSTTKFTNGPQAQYTVIQL